MKTQALLPVLSLLCSVAFGQSVQIEPGSFQLPQVPTKQTVTVADKGKVVFNPIDNKIYYADGNNWVEVAAVSPTPAFSAQATANFNVTSTQTSVVLFQNFEVGGDNFLPNTSMSNPNSFVAPYGGVYQFNFKGLVFHSNYTPAVNTRIKITIKVTYPNGSNSQVFYFPVQSFSQGTSISGYANFIVLSEGVVTVLHEIIDPQAAGTITLQDFYFQGSLITKN
jgi:hypothetical protein